MFSSFSLHTQLQLLVAGSSMVRGVMLSILVTELKWRATSSCLSHYQDSSTFVFQYRHLDAEEIIFYDCKLLLPLPFF
jgi:hypothetical protein